MKDKNFIFRFFERANAGDFEFVDRMTDEEVKSLSSFVLLMWAHGVRDHTETLTICNDYYLNGIVFSLAKHPRLLLKVFVEANSGLGSVRYGFKKSVTGEETLVYQYISQYYRCSIREAKDLKRMLSAEEIKEIKDLYEQ